MVTSVLLVILGLYVMVGIVLFMAWHSGTSARQGVVRLLDGRVGWVLPMGVFWRLGRANGSLGNKWPLIFGALPFIAFRAGEEWTETHGDPPPR